MSNSSFLPLLAAGLLLLGLTGPARADMAGPDPWRSAAGTLPSIGGSGTDGRPWRRILRVGPGRALPTPSAAAQIARDRDRIRIDAGFYRDCAIWRRNDLFIEGVGGRAQMADALCAGQAIWLISGDRIAIRNVAFSGAQAPAGNGAGIKFVGSTLTIVNALFHDNENGILTGPGTRSRIRVANSDFRRNGACIAACAHGLYVGHVRRLSVIDSTFFAQRIGHHIKSRAEFSAIAGNRIEDGPSGTASYAIDLSNAGAADISGNLLQKGPRADNTRALIAIGAEGASNSASGVRIRDNIFVSNNARLDAFVWNAGDRADVVLEGNRFEGSAKPLSGPGVIRP